MLFFTSVLKTNWQKTVYTTLWT